MINFATLTFTSDSNGIQDIVVRTFPNHNISYEQIYIANRRNCNDLINWVVSLGIKNILVWDGDLWGMFLDAYAATHNIPDYTNAGEKYRVQREPAIARTDTEAFILERKIWLWVPSCSKNNAGKLVLKSTVFTNVGNMFPNMCYLDAVKAFQVNNLSELVLEYSRLIYKTTGLEYLGEKKVNFLTTGAITKAFYLRLKYKDNTQIPAAVMYKLQHPLNERLELTLREEHLLTGGILYAQRGSWQNCNKYDVNSLYPDTYKYLGCLTVPRRCPSVKAIAALTKPIEKYEYILRLENVQLKRKAGKPAIWHHPDNPYKYHTNKEDVIIIEKWAAFSSLLKALQEFYIITFDVIECYECQRYRDAAAEEFTSKLYSLKAAARKDANEGLALIAKSLLNNFHGKLAQSPYYATKKYGVNSETHIVERHSEEVQKRGESFDYIRGAYIYAMANVSMLNRLKGLPQTDLDRIIYIDTDSIIFKNGATLSPQYIRQNELGFFKYEGAFPAVVVVQSKIYFLENEEGEIKPICAGHNAQEILNALDGKEDKYKSLSAKVKYLCSRKIPTRILRRTEYGGSYEYVLRPIISNETIDIFIGD